MRSAFVARSRRGACLTQSAGGPINNGGGQGAVTRRPSAARVPIGQRDLQRLRPCLGLLGLLSPQPGPRRGGRGHATPMVCLRGARADQRLVRALGRAEVQPRPINLTRFSPHGPRPARPCQPLLARLRRIGLHGDEQPIGPSNIKRSIRFSKIKIDFCRKKIN